MTTKMHKTAAVTLSKFADAMTLAADHQDRAVLAKLSSALEAYNDGDKIAAEALIEDILLEFMMTDPEVIDD